ncbi:Glutathione synthetase [Batrachochytrium dendrobatidis]|uniref:Glutathione synthetase n=1 Tax=Batrachochytrium dendrobatidis (strain JEL423) TaxID=403673 RepID=A0A177WMM5_BATDL|nr:Glutathione synthetase [Batrachochytrium dendrobatidis]KAK5671273.1 Glutathione synthetase [Batrachochytrium dendrobatidis]OAJ41056.1 glutathione synthetase [Batrachochytrium dendrobatidis JEL423]
MQSKLEADKNDLMESNIDWAMVNGLMIHPIDKNSGVACPIHIPFALVPSPYPLESYQLAYELQPLANLLVDQVANDKTFMDSVFQEVAKVDDFTKRLYQVYLETLRQPHHQTIKLGIHRSDYLLHIAADGVPKLRQIEINTISAGLPSLSSLASRLHRFNLDSPLLPAKLQLEKFPNATLPMSESLSGVANGIGEAWKLYNRPNSIVVMLVQPNEFNIFDQRWIEYTLRNNYGVRLMRKTLTEMDAQSRLEGSENRLFVDNVEVAVVYYRAGYTPRDYPSEREWTARTTIEISNAIKCPNIAYHLAGSKKIQQILAFPGVLERFLFRKSDVEKFRSTFAGLYPLDDSEEGRLAYQMAISNPEKFVLKPQREGGGNNIYGSQICTVLKSMTIQERSAYILMDLIVAPQFKASVVKERTLIERDVVSELGMFGVWLSDGQIVYQNSTIGHLMRTKSASVNEGGVATGSAVIDTPFLVSGLKYQVKV